MRPVRRRTVRVVARKAVPVRRLSQVPCGFMSRYYGAENQANDDNRKSAHF
jgi:hypothetical protein